MSQIKELIREPYFIPEGTPYRSNLSTLRVKKEGWE
jgi:Mg2+/Co2+ transporter CorB